MNSRVTVEFAELKDIAELERQWQKLEERSKASFFLSWSWMSTWLASIQQTVYVLRVTSGGTTIALGLFCEWQRSFGGLAYRELYLHKTGDKNKDQVWIEYNDFLVHPEYNCIARPAIASKVVRLLTDFRRIVVGASLSDLMVSFDCPELLVRKIWEAPFYGVDLDEIRQSGVPYLNTLSKNTRYNLRRTRRRLERKGFLQLREADSLDCALHYFDRLGDFHILRWSGKKNASGYLNPFFVAFHRELIKRVWPKGGVQLACLHLDEDPIAYIYNFIQDGVVYFYLGAYSKEQAEGSAGMLMHQLVIEEHQKRSAIFYDFMAGEARYKHSLGKYRGDMNIYAIEKNNNLNRLLNALRAIKRKFRDFR